MRNSYDITKGKLLRYSNSFSFAYLLFPPNCITGDVFFQLYNDNILLIIKQKMKIEIMWRMKNKSLMNECLEPILSRTMKYETSS